MKRLDKEVAKGTASLQSLREMADVNPEAALTSSNELLIQSEVPALLRLVAQAQRRLGNLPAAEHAEMLAVETSFADPRLQHADILAHQGQSAESAAAAANFLDIYPDDLLALTLLGEALLAKRRLTHAEELGRHITERAPAFVRGRILLGEALMLQCKLDEAIQLFERARPRPEDRRAREFLANLFTDAGQLDRAAETYEGLTQFDEDDANLWVNLGLALRFAGRKEEAERAFHKALRADQANGVAWWSLSGLMDPPVDPQHVKLLKKLLDQPWPDTTNRSHLHRALAILLDRSGEYEEAFRQLVASNEAARTIAKYDPEVLSREVSESISIFTKSFYVKRTEWGSRDDSPIFLVGMPRSGSTLIERVLGGHSKIEASGELQVVPRLVDELDAESGRVGGYRALIAQLPQDRVRALGEEYLQRSRQFRQTDKPFFTDKLHVNWRHLGLIRLILPRAKVIDVRRNAIDCCWSNFKTLFAKGHPAANDLRDIAEFYRDYRRLAEYFESLFPNDMLVMQYEEAVENLEAETRRMIEFLGLDFEPDCLQFHLRSEPVATASAEQVRRPLNREGIGAWRNYASFLDPLIQALGPYATEAEAA